MNQQIYKFLIVFFIVSVFFEFLIASVNKVGLISLISSMDNKYMPVPDMDKLIDKNHMPGSALEDIVKSQNLEIEALKEVVKKQEEALRPVLFKTHMDNLSKFYDRLDASVFQQYAEILLSFGFDLFNFVRMLETLDISKQFMEIEFELYLKNMQKSFKSFDDIKLTQKNLDFLKNENNRIIIIENISLLNKTLEKLSDNMPFKYSFEEEKKSLFKIEHNIKLLKNVDIKSLKSSKYKIRYFITGVSVATSLIPLLSTLYIDFEKVGGFPGIKQHLNPAKLNFAKLNYLYNLYTLVDTSSALNNQILKNMIDEVFMQGSLNNEILRIGKNMAIDYTQNYILDKIFAVKKSDLYLLPQSKL